MLSKSLPLVLVLALAGCQKSDQIVVRTAQEYDANMHKVEELTRPIFAKVDAGQPLSADETKSLAKAEAIFVAMRDFLPDVPNNHFALGRICQALGRPSAALGHYEQSLAILEPLPDRNTDENTLYAESSANIAEILILANRVEEADQAAYTALRAFPNDEKYLTLAARVRVQQKKYAEAKSLLQKALKSNPEYSPAKTLLKLIED